MNSRLDTLQAAILLQKLAVFDEELAARQSVAARYHELICRGRDAHFFQGVSVPVIKAGCEGAWAQYTLRLANRDDVQAELKAAGIPSVVYYPLPLSRQRAVEANDCEFPISEQAAGEVLSLPMHPYLDEHKQRQIVDILGRACCSAREST